MDHSKTWQIWRVFEWSDIWMPGTSWIDHLKTGLVQFSDGHCIDNWPNPVKILGRVLD